MTRVAGLLHCVREMRDYTDADFSDATMRREFLEELRGVERRAAMLDRATRHDVTNAAGAARNAVLLMDDDANTLSFARLVDIARRNSRIAAELLRAVRPPSEPAESGGNERNDLGRARERNDTDAFGL